MESQNTDEEDQFFDALDDFLFFDCLTFNQSDPSTSDLSSTLHRLAVSRRVFSSKEPGYSFLEASTLEDRSKTSSRDPSCNPYRDLKANDDTFEITELTRNGLNSTCVIDEKCDVESTVTTATNDELVDRARNSVFSGTELSHGGFPVS
ncbi:uncharacterized protein LOC111280511 isoform X2 [Durio zibethinus]|uniref:Uncharacterized protein LOC111280511 isoform X2 n=1 Tax=Durio zibethinus TaxID=66656 RepID=A0A6P5X7W3_DURZI|nr:uncharacterized protein LOC111280511 isoform X2 [Durio zibethinus]